MKTIWNILKWKKIIHFITNLKWLISANASPGVIYRIIDIDQESLEAVIKCVNIMTKIKDTIPKIIKDKDIISGLESIDACWLGYYYGDAVKNKSVDEIQKLNNSMNFLIQNKKGRYRIHSLNRAGTVSYVDTEMNIYYEELPVTLAKNAKLINHFDPSQACYIGILCGLLKEKSRTIASNVKPNLRIIK